MQIEKSSIDERPRFSGFGKRGSLDRSTLVLHLRLLHKLNLSGIAPTAAGPWLPEGYRSGVYYHKDCWDAGLVEVCPGLKLTPRGLELVTEAELAACPGLKLTPRGLELVTEAELAACPPIVVTCAAVTAVRVRYRGDQLELDLWGE